MITDKARALRRTIASALLSCVAITVLLACEEPVRRSASAPTKPTMPTTTPPAQSNNCVPNVAIHSTATGGKIQGAIKDEVLYWAGSRSNVECLPEAQQNQKQLNRVGSTHEGTPTYRVIRVHRTIGTRYYMLKYLNDIPVCIIDVTGACDRMLSALGNYDIDDLPDEAPALDGSTTTSVPRDYLFTLRSDDFTVVGTTPTAAAIVDYKIDVTAADVRDGVITAQLQRSASEGTWEPFPYTINGFVPHTEPKRAASLTLTYQVSAGYVRLIATAHLTGAEMSRALILFNDFKIRIRIVHYPWTILCRHPWFPCSRKGGTSPLDDHAGAAPDP